MDRRMVIAVAFGVGVLCFAGEAAHAEAPARFNPSCHGGFNDRLTGRTAPFTTEFSVDLTTATLCDRAYCVPLTQADPDRLAFDCSPGGAACNMREMKGSEIVLGTGGPFVRDDHLSIDRHTGAYRRTTAGYVGDRAAKAFSASYTGRCEARPFQEIAPGG
jgi:hypothetical protein